MEEEKAAAYYDELTRKGEGAARFKQGLGYSSRSSEANPPRAASSSSFLSAFVRASSPITESDILKEAQLKNVRDKLKSKSHASDDPYSGHSSSRRDRGEHDSSRGRVSRHREEDHRSESYDRRARDRRRGRSRSRSSSPRRRRSEKREKNEGIDYSRLIEGYADMSPAERVKAKMKFQLSETAAKDKVKGEGWERFEFDKDAPLDDEEIEVAEDDGKLVKSMEQGFRFSAVEAKRVAASEVAHDHAMFGTPAAPRGDKEKELEEPAVENDVKESKDAGLNLMSEKVLALQQGSWRDRARKGPTG